MQINKTALNAIVFCAIILFLLIFLMKPFLSIWLLFAGAAFYLALSLHPKKITIPFILGLSLVVYTPYIATKIPWYVLGNDKPQYLGFMRDLMQGDFWQSISAQPEVVSFLLLKISAEIFGPTNDAFALIFLLSFGSFIIGTYKIYPAASVAFIALFLASSVSFNIFGNTIRQGLALSFFLLALSQTDRKKILYVALAVFSHFSSFIIIPYIMLKPILLKMNSRLILMVATALFILGYLLPEIMSNLSFAWSYLEKKRSLYVEYESTESGAARITFFLSFFIVFASRLRSINNLFNESHKIKPTHQYAMESLYSVTLYLFFILLLTMQISDFFARFYLYYFTFSMLYITVYIYTRRNAYIRISGVSLLILYAFYSMIKNMSYFSLFYCGSSSDYMFDSWLEINKCF